MGIKDKLEEYQRDTFLEKHGDRIAPILGNVLSIKVERKKKFFIFHILEVNMVVKPQRSKNVVRCQYKKKAFFNEPTFMDVAMGNEVLVQGMKGEKGKNGAEIVTIMNLVNFSNDTQLVDNGEMSVEEIKAQIRGSVKRQRI